MHRFAVLLAFGVASVLAIKEECLQLASEPAIGCCKAPPLKPDKLVPLEECIEQFGKKAEVDDKCELEQCVAKKRGFLAEDGTIDMKALEAAVADSFENHPKFIENVHKNCINGDFKEYGFEHFCELKKINYCMNVQYVMSCPDYDDQEKCSGIKALAEKCAAE